MIESSNRYRVEHILYEGYYIIDTFGQCSKVSMNWFYLDIRKDEIKARLGDNVYNLGKYKFENQVYFIPNECTNDKIPHIETVKGLDNEKYKVLEATADYYDIKPPKRNKIVNKCTPKEILEDKLNENRSDDFRIK